MLNSTPNIPIIENYTSIHTQKITDSIIKLIKSLDLSTMDEGKPDHLLYSYTPECLENINKLTSNGINCLLERNNFESCFYNLELALNKLCNLEALYTQFFTPPDAFINNNPFMGGILAFKSIKHGWVLTVFRSVTSQTNKNNTPITNLNLDDDSRILYCTAPQAFHETKILTIHFMSIVFNSKYMQLVDNGPCLPYATTNLLLHKGLPGLTFKEAYSISASQENQLEKLEILLKQRKCEYSSYKLDNLYSLTELFETHSYFLDKDLIIAGYYQHPNDKNGEGHAIFYSGKGHFIDTTLTNVMKYLHPFDIYDAPKRRKGSKKPTPYYFVIEVKNCEIDSSTGKLNIHKQI